MPRRVTVATIPGDGIGPEVFDAAAPVIGAAAGRDGVTIVWERMPYGADHYLATGETLPEAALARLRDGVDAIFVGALGDPRIPDNEHARDILLGLRFKLDLYVNFRPVRLLHESLCPLKMAVSPAPPRALAYPPPPAPPASPAGAADGRAGAAGANRRRAAPPIDFVIFRENTEGVYLGRGRSKAVGTAEEEQIAEEVHTAPRVSRILRAAFEWARAHGKDLVTMSDKSNAVPAHRLWQRLFPEIGGAFPEIEREHRFVDALAMELVRDPTRFQVIVTGNLFGDILSDLGAQLVGGLGVAASANLHPGRPGLFEPVHGSAPPLAGRGIANPMAAVLTGALMLDRLGAPRGARALESAVAAAVAAGVTTPDLGGTAPTAGVADWIGHRAEAVEVA